MTHETHCAICGQEIIPDRLHCANCRKPMGKNDTFHHDQWSRAVHWNCDRPTLKPEKLAKRKK